MTPTRSVGATRTTTWLWLTAPITVLLVIAAGGELIVDGILRGDDPTLVAQTVGFNYVTLAVALPVLAGSAVLAGRGSARAWSIWLGALAYVLYTYVIYAFHVRFNSLFLAYVGLVGLSLYALIGGLATMDFEALKGRFAGGTPVKAASVFLAAVTALFYGVSLSEVIPALLTGTIPPSVADAGTPTGSPHVLDMAWMLPAMGLTAVWLWRGRPIAYALTGALLAFLSLMTLAIGAMMVAVYLHGEPAAPGMAAVFAVFSATSVGMLVWFLRFLESGGQPLSDSASRVVGTGDVYGALEELRPQSAAGRDAPSPEIVRKGAPL